MDECLSVELSWRWTETRPVKALQNIKENMPTTATQYASRIFHAYKRASALKAFFCKKFSHLRPLSEFTTNMCFQQNFRPVAAASRLSYDILWYLFGFVMIDNGDKGPTTISHVCHSWRAVALQTPFLWTKITMRMYYYSQVHKLAISRFERSGKRPLDITIHCMRNLRDQEKEVLIFSQAHRIRRLVVHSAGGGQLAKDIWAQLNVHMPLLESFDTCILPDSRFCATREVTSPDDLTSLIPFTSPTMALDWMHWNPIGLTSLTLESQSFSSHIPMFASNTILTSNAGTLQHFAYEGLTPVLDADDYCPPIQFPQLHSLYLSYFDDIIPLLVLFESPNLRSLTLRNFIACPSNPTFDDDDHVLPDHLFATAPDQLLEALGRWSGSLRELKIYGIDDVPEEQTAQYLRSLVHLESLYLYGRGGAERFAEILFSQDAEDGFEAPLLPKLTHLLCTAHNHDERLDLLDYLSIRKQQKLPRLEKLILNIKFYSFLLEAVGSLDFLKDASIVLKAVDNPVQFQGVLLQERTMILD